MSRSVRRVGSLAVTLVLGSLLARSAVAAATLHFDLPAQPLADALREAGTLANANVMFDDGLVEGKRARPVQMDATLDEALTRMLVDTGLTHRFLNEQTVVLERERETQRGAATVRSTALRAPVVEGSMSDTVRVAQATSPGGQTSATAGSGAEREEQGSEQLQEIVVTGTHIRGNTTPTLPQRILDRAYIDASGVSTTAALIETLPQNFSLNTQAGLFVPGTTSSAEQGASINLRGIGEGTTLVLLDGHRIAPGFIGSAVDITGLPLSAIERVEVVTDGASALYGSDAVGGVVNFVLRKDFEGAQTDLRFGSARGGVDEYRIGQLAGHSWGSGNALVNVDYYKRDLLLASDRSFVPADSLVGSLLPRDKNWSAMVSGRQQISDSTSAFLETLYTKRDSFNFGGLTAPFNEQNSISNPQVSATAGLD